jgi:hypothetical protein
MLERLIEHQRIANTKEMCIASPLVHVFIKLRYACLL